MVDVQTKGHFVQKLLSTHAHKIKCSTRNIKAVNRNFYN